MARTNDRRGREKEVHERITPRCREQMDQCRYPDGRRCTDAVARPVMTRHTYACEVCGREYPAKHVRFYADIEVVFE